MRSIRQIKNIKAKTVLLLVDFNVPVKNGKVMDDFRIKATLPTINFLLKKGAKIILITHFGKDGTASLDPIAKHFFRISKIDKNRVTFFDNIRKFSGEMKNDVTFAKKLSKMGDIYVNEAFSVSHREHASVVSLPKYLPSFAGLQLEKEIKNLSYISQKPKHPFLFVLSGAKFSTKIPLLEKYLKLADYVFVGGALANYLLKAKGYKIGKSLVDEKKYDVSKILNSPKLILPTDFVVKNEAIVDIGKESVKNLASIIKKSKFILWNGPLGKYEDGGAKATEEILKLVLKSKSQVIIGGGDIVSILSKLKPKSHKPKANLFVSTGGGATLEFLANGTLPGIKALL
ncbi:phosphoglycerate kinase [Candidatus Nomurabacteria bacterium GWB1_40_6]|uniref:Phosphoglycerate kinase n=1 Tax=Candidatus Nomurabacteria bacterium GWB1_40_6 TaxID=1801727 RepID=A0A1F6TK63_9BACT|nr:MAG: phosphoglycerate kinase [Candidatus Nomurabacteria bacterium GWB1_40_6]